MQRQSSISAVVFDLDGLMINSEEIYSQVGCELLKRRGKEIWDGLTNAMMGRTAREAFSIMIEWCDLAETVDQLQVESDEIFDHLAEAHLEPKPGLIDLLNALASVSIPRAVATSSRRRYAQDILARFDWEFRFEFVLSGDDVTRGKPHPEIYESAACRFGLRPSQLMVLEDSENGCLAAINAGTFTVAVPGKHSENQDFSRTALVADSLYDPRIYHKLGIPRVV